MINLDEEMSDDVGGEESKLGLILDMVKTKFRALENRLQEERKKRRQLERQLSEINERPFANYGSSNYPPTTFRVPDSRSVSSAPDGRYVSSTYSRRPGTRPMMSEEPFTRQAARNPFKKDTLRDYSALPDGFKEITHDSIGSPETRFVSESAAVQAAREAREAREQEALGRKSEEYVWDALQEAGERRRAELILEAEAKEAAELADERASDELAALAQELLRETNEAKSAEILAQENGDMEKPETMDKPEIVQEENIAPENMENRGTTPSEC